MRDDPLNDPMDQPFLNLDPRFQARLVFQEELQNHAKYRDQRCELCDELVAEHAWAIVDGLGFVVIACSTIVDNHFTVKRRDEENGESQ